jgi:GMP synthase-like glutamine amidotransferase
MTKLNIGILEVGRPPEELKTKFSDYPQMAIDWLGDIDANFSRYAVLDCILPSNVKDADIWIIMGSRFGVYEPHDWIAPLEEFVRATQKANGKMFGICFGHQLIAQALGGRVEKSEKGWGVGIHSYKPTNNWPEKFCTPPETISIQAFHQDQVVELPVGAEQVATSDFCEHAALWYPNFALTFQGHPEFSSDYVTALLESRRGNLFSDSLVDDAFSKRNQPTQQKHIAQLIGQHISDI